MRDVRLAFADLVLADERLRLAEESVRLRSQITELAEARLRAGSASELEVMTARIDKLMEEQRAGRLAHDRELAAERLRLLMGAADLHKALAELERSVGRPVVGTASQATIAAAASEATTAATVHLPLDTIETLP
jgi:cobalt-zinc-cadmium efflux system outer membrane protein